MEGQGDNTLGRRSSVENDTIAPSMESFDGRVNDGRRLEEEMPTMRAVALVNAPTLMRDQTVTRDFGFLSPLRSGVTTLKPDSKLFRSTSEGFGVKKEWSGQVKVPDSWILKSDCLERVPVDFPLERTHREIHGADPSEVASRVSDALRILSIEAEYDCVRAKAKCRTADFVSFRIRLYAGGENNQPVVVEVQRRSGPAFSFMQSCRAILDAAEGVKLPQPSKKRGPPPFVTGPIGNMKCLNFPPPMSKKCLPSVPPVVLAADAVCGVVTLLSSGKRDANVLGLENLSCLTDPLRTHPSSALHVCKIVALGDATHSLREDIVALLQPDVIVELEPEEGETGNGFVEQMRHLSLVVFSNALSMTGKEGSLSAAVKEQDWYGAVLIPLLLDEIKCAGLRPNCAHEAVCCVTSLVEASDEARKLFSDGDGIEILKEAYTIGVARHELLANEVKRCLSAFD